MNHKDLPSQTIHYFDAYPGVGKTALAVDYMIRECRNKVSLYVAPRIALLKEVYRRLEQRGNELYDKKVISDEDYYEMTRDDGVGRMPFIVGVSLEQNMTAGQLLREKVNLARPGDFILCTHENFVRNGKFDRDLDDIVVIFDEARKMVLERRDQRVTVTNEQKTALFKFLKPYRHPIYQNLDNGDKRYSGFCRFSATDQNETDILRNARVLLHEKSEETGVDTSPSSAFRTMVRDLCNDRLDVYLKMPLSLEGMFKEELTFEERQQGLKEKQSIFQVLSPARLFEGFSHVLIMSAYFKQSQIYHLLRNYHTIHPEYGRRFVLKPLKLTEEQKTITAEHRSMIESRFRKVTIYPLLSKEQKVSSTNLGLSCLMPREKLEEFFTELERSGIERSSVGAILRGHSGVKGKGSVRKAHQVRSLANRMLGIPLDTEDPDFKTFKRRGYSDPMTGYFHMTQHVVYTISQGAESKKRNCIIGKPLISFNKKFMEAYKHVLPNMGEWYSGKFHCNSIASLIEQPSQSDLEDELARNADLGYDDRIYATGERGSFVIKFQHVIADPMGLNTYRDRNFMAYLSARNPTPEVAALFRALIPSYSADDDYAGDSAVQAVTRLSVRDQYSSDRVYIVVPDLGLARILQRKLSVHHADGEPMEAEDQDGAKINLFFAKKLDYVDVLSSIPRDETASRRSQATTQKTDYVEELSTWPKELQRLHRILSNEEMTVMWKSALRHGVVGVPKAKLLMERATHLREFLKLAEQTLRSNDVKPTLSKVYKMRAGKRTEAATARVVEACEKVLKTDE